MGQVNRSPISGKFIIEGGANDYALGLTEAVGEPDAPGDSSPQMGHGAQWQFDSSYTVLVDQPHRSPTSLQFIFEGGGNDYMPGLTEDVGEPDALGELLLLLLVDKNVNERVAARGVMQLVESFLGCRDFVSLNRTLQKVDAAEVSIRFTVALLRSTFRVADYLPAWHAAVSRAHDAFVAKGEDADWLLAGLRN
ncbi:MAG: hypothetical protein IV094_14175 [Vitreoscilla sp.]|nr:hypothetical protein [Vitreoscilla sp.]